MRAAGCASARTASTRSCSGSTIGDAEAFQVDDVYLELRSVRVGLPRDNYSSHRIDSPVLLPASHRCLINMLPVGRWSEGHTMGRQVHMTTRKELLEVVRTRYSKSTRAEKGRSSMSS